MRAKEFVIEKRRKKRIPKYAAYGPGPYGWYGYDASYSGDSGGGDGGVGEGWSEKYKRSINCDNPKGFSQRAHCQGRKKNESVEPDDVHKLADKKKVDWDNNPKFLALSKKITGVSHLDQMNQSQLKKMLAYLKSLQENGDEQGEVKFQKNLIPMPKGTVKVDVSDPLDWYNLGMSISDLDDADPREFGKGPPQTVITFGSEPEEHRYIKQLKRLGMPVHDIDEETLSELNIPQTLNFIKQAHGDQLYGKLPYWTHPRAVAMTGKKIFGNRFNSDAVKVAFLHDVVEDTNISLEELSKLDFAPEVIEAVGLLTKNKALNYSQNIERIIGSGNNLAMMVKYADNYENYSGDKSSWDPKKAESSQKKYLMSLNMLGNKLGVDYHQKSVDENFADGKKPGRKGLAKRSGVPTKASVSRLRQIAKSSSGEKQRMAHWLANMKSGRNKSK